MQINVQLLLTYQENIPGPLPTWASRTFLTPARHLNRLPC
jgi:hypothetical protein